MAFNVINQASKYSAAYSPIPFRFKDDEVGTVGYYNYLVYLIIEPTDTTSVVLNQTTREYTITTLRPHKLKVGDDVVMYGGSEVIDNNSVTRVISDDEFVVPLNGELLPSSFRLGRYITYRQAPDVRGEASFDFSNTLRDFVESEYKDNFSPVNAVETKVRYEVISLKVTQPSLDFFDDIFVTTPGSVNDIGFIFPNTTVGEVSKSFKIGDTVNIEREAQTYRYNVSFNSSSNFNVYDFGGNICYLDIPSTSNAISPDGRYNPNINQIISIDPDNNGINQGGGTGFLGRKDVSPLPSSTPPPFDRLFESVPYSNDTSVFGGGTLTGQVNLKYNGVTTIREIRQVGSAVHIGIEKTVGYSSPAVGGTMTLLNSTVVDENILYNSGEQYAYVGRQGGYTYDLNYMFPYVYTGSGSRDFSTIYNPNDKINIERNSKQKLLAHISKDVDITQFRVDNNYYDANGNFLGRMSYDLIDYVSFGSGDDYDFYIPGDINSWLAGNNTAGSPLFSVVNDVDFYNVLIVDSGNFNQPLFNQIQYKIYDECSAYQIYELFWKDRMGSYLSFPFAFKHKETMEVTRNSYYKDYNGFKDDGSFELPSYRKGKKEFFVKSKQKFTLNSGWATDKESEYIKDMFQSTDVYVKLPSGEIIGCNILGNSIEVKKKQNFDLFNYKINIVTSLQDIRL